MRVFKYLLILGLFFTLFVGTPTVNAQYQDGGAFSAYLVGTYENCRAFFVTQFQIINPTLEELYVVAAFYDMDGNLQGCKKDTLKANDMCEIFVPFYVPGLKPFTPPDHGIVKIISYKNREPKRGIVGYQRQIKLKTGVEFIAVDTVTESNLASVPTELAKEELNIILSKCP